MNKQPLYDDLDVWRIIEPGNLWFFNKLQVAKFLGYTCGPAGEPVPEAAEYVVRPCVNLLGMGKGAKIKWLENETESLLKAGDFWCEKFEGRHISVDYTDREPILAIEGLREEGDPLWMWREWRRLDVNSEDSRDSIPEYPRICDQIVGHHPHINVEFIGDKVIEIHFRHNPDWRYLPESVTSLVPVYDHTDHPDFISNPEDRRLGFIMKKD